MPAVRYQNSDSRSVIRIKEDVPFYAALCRFSCILILSDDLKKIFSEPLLFYRSSFLRKFTFFSLIISQFQPLFLRQIVQIAASKSINSIKTPFLMLFSIYHKSSTELRILS